MKNFFKEFKAFISRGNVMDMAVGIIVGGAFTAIITAIVNNILNPLLAMIPGTEGLGALQIVLRAVYTTNEAGEQVLDKANSVIMDFGVVITAIITFVITAFVLFLIVKAVNSVRDTSKKLVEKQKKAIEEKLKKGEISEEEALKEQAEIEQPAPAAPKVTAEELLIEIRDLLKENNSKTE